VINQLQQKMSKPNKKYVVFMTSSLEKLEEVRPHFSKYNIECLSEFISTCLPIAVLKEYSELNKHPDGTATMKSDLIVEQIEEKEGTPELVTKRVYTSKAHGFMINDDHENELDPKPWGWDAKFIPDGLMISYYKLKKQGLKISPRDMNIGQFLQDFIHYNTNSWTFKELSVSRPVDLEADYRKILFDFFDIESQTSFIGYEFWKSVINSAVSGGVFIRASNTRKMNNYWFPTANGGLPVTSKPKDPMQEKTYMMHDIFHYLVPDLLYTGNIANKKYYEWSYTFHRVMTACFTLVLGDMFYVHYLIINGVKYEKRRIYPIFEAIYGKRTGVFTIEVIEEVVRASAIYGLHGYDAGFVALFVKYNGSYKLDEFRTLLKSFHDKYDYYLIQDLKWTVHNASYMKEHSKKYEYLNNLEPITRRLEIITLDSLELETSNGSKQDVNFFVDIGLKQLHKALSRQVFPPNTILKNKFLRWALGQLCFFEHYSGIPILDGNSFKFYDLVQKILTENHMPITLNKIRNFLYQWGYLMDRCVEMQVITLEEAKQYKEVFPIFDQHYISSYEDRSENHIDVMNNFLSDFEF
jgi:hypothetical protein